MENVIEVRVEEIAQLFDTLDPFPFRERDLDKHAEEYIVSWAREFPRNQPIKIIIHAPENELRSQHANQLSEALGRYFNYRAEAVGRDLNELFRVGRQSLLIGVAVLATCVLTARAVTAGLGAGNLSGIMKESLIILGWVANWKPIEIFLYDWWPLARHRDLYHRLAAASVEHYALTVTSFSASARHCSDSPGTRSTCQRIRRLNDSDHGQGRIQQSRRTKLSLATCVSRRQACALVRDSENFGRR